MRRGECREAGTGRALAYAAAALSASLFVMANRRRMASLIPARPAAIAAPGGSDAYAPVALARVLAVMRS